MTHRASNLTHAHSKHTQQQREYNHRAYTYHAYTVDVRPVRDQNQNKEWQNREEYKQRRLWKRLPKQMCLETRFKPEQSARVSQTDRQRIPQ